MLADFRDRQAIVARSLGIDLSDAAFAFSYEPNHGRPCNPDGITHRYGRMCKGLRIESRLHALRHYAATELINAGVDIRDVAGQLGHGEGGATTLRVYTASQQSARCGTQVVHQLNELVDELLTTA